MRTLNCKRKSPVILCCGMTTVTRTYKEERLGSCPVADAGSCGCVPLLAPRGQAEDVSIQVQVPERLCRLFLEVLAASSHFCVYARISPFLLYGLSFSLSRN